MTATWLSYAGFYFSRKVFGIVKKDLSDAFDLSDLELAHIWTAYLVAYMLGQFLAAGLGRRLTCRLLLLIGMFVSIVATVFQGLQIRGTDGILSGMMLFMTINGVAQATGWPGNVGLLSKWTRRHERGTLMAIWGTCYQIGSILAKHFAAFMLAWLGLAWSFWGASLVFIAIWFYFFFNGQERPRAVGLPPLVEEVTVDADPGDPRNTDGSLPFAQVLPVIVAMGLVYFCFKFNRYALDSWAPKIIAETFNLRGSTAGHISTIFDWVGFMGVIAAGICSDRLFSSRRMPVIVSMTVGMALAMIALRFSVGHSLLLFSVLLGLVGFMLMGPDSLIAGTSAMEVSSKETAVVAAGIINGLGSIGPIIQEEVIGWVKTVYGTDFVFIIMAAVTLLAVLGTLLLWRMSARRGLKM